MINLTVLKTIYNSANAADHYSEQLSKYINTIKISQEFSKSNTKSFENKTISKEYQPEKTATQPCKGNKKFFRLNQTSCGIVNRKTDKLERTKIGSAKERNWINQMVKM